MKKLDSTTGLICAVCFLSCIAVNGALASSIVPTGGPAQARQEDKIMNLVELVQRLEDANPWTVEKVSEALGGVDLTLARSDQYIYSYTANDIAYEDGLLFREIWLRHRSETKKMIRIILSVSRDTKCYTLANLEKMYPNIHDEQKIYDRGVNFFAIKRSWGRILFGFENERLECLGNIVFVPKEEE
ncbi:MAG: hypothetical protein FWF12_07650 [Betaproteobacteria bacterium]|nr:hypothetical protein [Betaproteobacteria bacterium]